MYALNSLPNHAMYISFISSTRNNLQAECGTSHSTSMRGRSSHNNNLKHTIMKYTVVIVETLSRKVEVDAADAQEAKRIVADQYNSEQIVLSADDFYGYEIETL